MRTLLALLPVLAALPASAEEEEETRWPTSFKPRQVEMKPVPGESGALVVETAHFRIESDRPINQPDLQRFANVIESVPVLVARMPLALSAPPKVERVRILLFREEADYKKEGGHDGTIGFYDGRRRLVLLRADYFLSPPSAQPTRLRPRPNENLLVHELVHTSMDGILRRVPPWLREGTAEYFASAHKGNGWYTFHDIDTSIRDRIRRAAQPDKSGRVTLPSVGSLLDLDSREWLKACSVTWMNNPFLPYTTALLVTHYHFHGGRDRRDQATAWFEALHELDPRQRTPPFAPGKADEIEKRLKAYWAPRGLNIVFADE